MRKFTAVFVVLTLVCVGVAAGFVPQQDQAPTKKKSKQPPSRVGFPGLVEAIQNSPGCLGVENAQTRSGKSVVFAWFEDKDAVMTWFHSPMHQKMMNQFFPDREEREPMANVPDGAGPILAIASITPTKGKNLKETNLPVSQIAIELYTPVPGGLALGGRFAPKSVKVNNLVDYASDDE